jgi:hypothetical protein
VFQIHIETIETNRSVSKQTETTTTKKCRKSSKIKNVVHKAVKLKIEKCILKCEVTKAGNNQL